MISKVSEVDYIESKWGEKLMFKRVLIRQPTKDEPKHRRALFRIRCKILGKVCKVIVNLGSKENIISEEVVEKLKLVRVPHISPYKVIWLNKRQSVFANEKNWVEFSIVGYKTNCFVTYCLWMHVIYCWVDLDNMTIVLSMMGRRILSLSRKVIELAKFSPCWRKMRHNPRPLVSC